ncbi:MAG: ATP-dependent metallopeptidase FtsH/Yme1/Tma family protein, partial [Pseudomonadota bacterium]
MNDSAKNILIFIAIVLVLMTVVQSFQQGGMTGVQEEKYSDFLNRVDSGQVDNVTFDGPAIQYTTNNGQKFLAYNPESDTSILIGELKERNVSFEMPQPKGPNLLFNLFINSFPILLLIAVWVYFMRQMQGGGAGGRGAMSFGKSKARLLGEDQVGVTFADVAGVEEAK